VRDGAPYSPTRLWLDLFKALNSAQKLIYITGWSVFTEVFTKKKCEN
jgi:phospholipase D1/2